MYILYEYVYVYIYIFWLSLELLCPLFSSLNTPQLDVFSKQRSSWVAGLIIPPIKSILQEFGFNYSKFTFDHPEHQDHKMAFLSFFPIIGLSFKKTQPKKQNDKKLRRYAKITTSPSPSQEIPRNGFLRLGGLNSYNWRIYGIHGIWAIYTIQSLTSLNVSAILLRNPLLNYTFWGDQPAGKVVVNCPDGMKIMKNQPFIVGTSLMDIG